MLLGGSEDFSATANYEDCNLASYPSDISGSATWSSSNTAVATMGGTYPSQCNAVGAGSSTATANYSDCVYLCSSYPDCSSKLVGKSGHSSITVQKPTFLWPKSRTAPDYSVCLGLGCEIDTYYQVLDGNKNPINLSEMSVAETVNTDPSTQCVPNVNDKGKWTTDSTGTITIADAVYMCCPSGETCSEKIDQSFTVNGSSVLVLSADKSTSGSYQVVGTSCNNGQGSCPSWAPQP